jgi:hypothetical protein
MKTDSFWFAASLAWFLLVLAVFVWIMMKT